MDGGTFFHFTIGNLADLVAFLIGAVGLIYGLGRKQESIERMVAESRSDIVDLKEDIKKLNDVVTQLAVTSTRMDMFDRRLDDVVHGRIRIVDNDRQGSRS